MKKAIYLICATLISGCATRHTSEVALSQGMKSQFQVPATIISNDTTKILESYLNGLLKTSNYQGLEIDYKTRWRLGIRGSSHPSENRIFISYVNESGTTSAKNNITATFDVAIKKIDQNYLIDVTCPSGIKHEVNAVIGLIQPFITKEKVAIDIQKMCAKAPITFYSVEIGDIDTKFNDSSVYANFLRKAKSYSPTKEEIKQYDIEKGKWFILDLNKEKYRVAISVYPYRNGSKVVYKANKETNCHPSVPCIDDKFGERLKAKITEIAND